MLSSSASSSSPLQSSHSSYKAFRKRNYESIGQQQQQERRNSNNNNQDEFVLTSSSSRSSSSRSSSSSSSSTEEQHQRPSSRSSNESIIIVASVAIYWTFVSLIPIYNKYFFQKDLYPYPIATAGIQLFVVSVLLGIVNVIQRLLSYYYYYYHYNNNNTTIWQSTEKSCGSGGNTVATSVASNGNDNINNNNDNATSSFSNSSSSWIFGPHFLWKLQWCAPIGILFGLKYGVTNWGLHLVPAPTHLLLQSTDLVWTVLGAWWINGEHVKPIELFCLLGCIVGSFVLSWNQLKSGRDNDAHDATTTSTTTLSTLFAAPWFAILINLLSPILLGLCISTLRLACTELMRPDNRVSGSVSAVELTSIKLLLSSLVATILATLLEGGSNNDHPHHQYDDNIHTKPSSSSWWQAFYTLDHSTRLGVIGGALLIAAFQVNCTFLTSLTNAISVGLVGQVKIIPQWIVAAIFATTTTTSYRLQKMNIIGAILIMTSAAAYCGSNYYYYYDYYHDETDESDKDSGGGGVSRRREVAEDHYNEKEDEIENENDESIPLIL